MATRIRTFDEYQSEYKKSVEQPEAFWAEQAETFVWKKKWDKVLNWNFKEPKIEWFVNGKLNITENCLDRHLATRANQTAILWEPNDPSESAIKITYKELHEKVCQVANVLKAHGIVKGDRVCLYMPMVPELAIACLACARLGAVLEGLLEDRVLEDVADLHCVVDPISANVPRTGGLALVATCSKSWLREVLAPLQASGLVVQRLVPELSPRAQPLLCVMGTPALSQSVLCHSQGVTFLPPNVAQWRAFPVYAAYASQAPSQAQLVAEPAMVERVEQFLQRRPVMQNAAQRAVVAAQSDWDLAQGEWAQGTSQRFLRLAQHVWQTLFHAPAWRSVRIGLATLSFASGGS